MGAGRISADLGRLFAKLGPKGTLARNPRSPQVAGRYPLEVWAGEPAYYIYIFMYIYMCVLIHMSVN